MQFLMTSEFGRSLEWGKAPSLVTAVQIAKEQLFLENSTQPNAELPVHVPGQTSHSYFHHLLK